MGDFFWGKDRYIIGIVCIQRSIGQSGETKTVNAAGAKLQQN